MRQPIVLKSFHQYLESLDASVLNLWWALISRHDYTEVTFGHVSPTNFDRESIRHVMYTILLAILQHLVTPNVDQALSEALQMLHAEFFGTESVKKFMLPLISNI